MVDDASVMLVRETLVVVLKIAAPILGAGMLVGLVISLIQSVTSIQDQTLTTVPKIVVMVVVAAMLAPWIAQRLMEFAQDLFTFAV
ncbi:MAG: flagellar biosynthetic protein FliQ [Phycisphaeraceae bacterium]|nr:flagellar biosynthetic protein FliQ [Phycisphaeraceae bacterium]MCW5754083.1 flagellar biosynthetic protein FliQ [Phycisphaeraceae bacterium]